MGHGTHRDESGAIGTETIAIVVLVAAAIAAVWSIGIDRRVAEEGHIAVCNLFNQDGDCVLLAEAEVEDGPDGPDGPDDPTTADGPVPPSDIGDLPDTEVNLTHAVEQCGVVHAAWDATVASGGFSASYGNVGVSVSGGTTTSGSLTTTPEHLAAVGDGEAPVPDPFDPTTLPPGAAMEFGREHFEALGLGVAYGALGLELGFSSGEAWSIGVVREPDGSVQLMIGESSVIGSSLAGGVSVGPVEVAGALASSTSDSEVQLVTIDITAPGGLETYLAALTAQAVPGQNAPGVTGTGSITQNVWEQLAQFGVSLTPAVQSEIAGHEASLGLNIAEATGEHVNQEASNTWIVDDEGNVTLVYSATAGGSTITITTPMDGTEDDRTFSLVLDGVEPQITADYGDLAGQPVAAGDHSTIRIDFTADQLRAIQDMAAALVGDREVEQLPGTDDLYRRLADAEDLGEVLRVLHLGGPLGLLDDLLRLAADHAEATDQTVGQVLADLGLEVTPADADGCFPP